MHQYSALLKHKSKEDLEIQTLKYWKLINLINTLDALSLMAGNFYHIMNQTLGGFSLAFV